MKRFILLLLLLLAGCVSRVPMPAPAPMPESKKSCDMTVGGECREMSASEKGGAGSRGHTQEPKNDKMMFYVPPEELWPEEFPAKPKVCASPFQGNQLLR